MPFAQSDYLPSNAELEVEEVNMTSSALRAGAHHFGKYCDHQSKEFMLCNQEEKDPRKCINEGKEVTRCALEFFRKMKSSCAEQFTQYSECIDYGSYNMNMSKCRKPQAAFDKCVFETLGQERPELGYFSKVRVHKTTRAKPQRVVELPEPTPEPANPREVPVPDSVKHGSRVYFFP